MSQKIVLIKLGGSIITNKEVPMMVRKQVLKRLVADLVKAQIETNQTYIIGHGSGSFAHAPALRYGTKDGFIHAESKMGMAITQDSAAKLNRIVIEEFLNKDFPAVSFAFSNSLVTKNNQCQSWNDAVFNQYLINGLSPIVYGDVIVDSKKGCTIWSTETILSFLVDWLQQKTDYQPKQVVYVNEVAGVLDQDRQIIPEISIKNADTIKKMMTRTKGFDVTGGMWHKIEEALKLSQKGVETFVISGLIKNNLYQLLTEQSYQGTHVSAK